MKQVETQGSLDSKKSFAKILVAGSGTCETSVSFPCSFLVHRDWDKWKCLNRVAPAQEVMPRLSRLTVRPSSSLLPYRPPIISQFSRQDPFHPLRLLIGQRVESRVEIRPQPHAVAPHVGIVFDAVLM